MRIAVVIVTHNSADHIGATLRGLAAQLDQADELVVVDNASTDHTRDAVRSSETPARLLGQPGNLGFAAGCNAGAASSSAPLLLFLNPDAEPAPDCLDELRVLARERPEWGAWQALVTMDSGATVNTAGNVSHFLGIGWAGLCGRPISEAPVEPREVAFASGAALVVRREPFDEVGGFEERYFMYCEDLDLCLRLWLTGRGVGVAPGARVEHDYDFHKGARKWFLLERNRWWTVLSDYPAALLALLAPALLAAELGLLVVAARDGWLGSKLHSQAAVLRELPQILARRRRIQATRSIHVSRFAALLSAELDNPNLGPVAQVGPLVALQRFYWVTVLRLLESASRR